MSTLVIHSDSCKACGFCIRECPKGALALSASLNEKGYTPVAVDEEKCTKCGICYWVCPDCVLEMEV